jgi:signal transduction histidine kinase/ABC-type uncharacterized transport system substrate-binding protein
MIAWVIVASPAWAQSPKNVLVIHGGWPKLPYNMVSDEQIESVISNNRNIRIQIFNEYMDEKRLAVSTQAFAEVLRQKYTDKKVDLILAVSPAALNLLLGEGATLWPGVPIVFLIVDRRMVPPHLPANVTGVMADVDFAGTLEFALRLQPETKQVFYIVGDSQYEQFLRHAAEGDLEPFAGRVQIEYLDHLPLSKLLTRVGQLPSNSVIFFQEFNRDVDGEIYVPAQVCAQVGVSSSVPVYVPHSVLLGRGTIGGSFVDYAGNANQAARLAVGILNGERIENLPPKMGPKNQIYVDWRELQRWHLKEANLPPGTIIVNREPSVWQKYKIYILVAMMLIVLEFLLIFYLLAERRRRRLTQKQLADRLRFETFLAEVSAAFANPGKPGIDNAIQECLQKVGSFFGGGIASIWQWSDKSPLLFRTHSWSGIHEKFLREVPAAYFSNSTRRLLAGEDIYFSNETEMNQLEDCRSFRKSGIKAFLAIPLRDERQFIGALSISNHEREMTWPADFVSRMHTIAEILGSALARKIAADALKESESLTGSILETLRSSVAIVDNEGTILEVNQRWVDFATANDNPPIAKVAAGVNYLDICRKAGTNEEAEEALRGIQSVLTGSQQMFEMDYSCHSPSEQRWFRMTVALLSRSRGGAVISHLDITQQKLAELEQRRMREEAAQMNRAREMGQLAASLTHELAQPLAAVLSNAQAAARLATTTEPDLPEIQEALADIIRDDKRACAVLDNVRAILKKHTIRPHTVNLNEIVEDVTLIVRSDALLNGVQFRSILSSDAVPVQGDEVPLQQVLLNLVNNSMAAMREIPRDRRTLTIKTQVQNGFGLLLVEDEGPGIPDSLKANLFLPFFTTKSEGLGMGLSICATILESLGGSISFANLPGRGAAFSVQLRLAQQLNSLL